MTQSTSQAESVHAAAPFTKLSRAKIITLFLIASAAAVLGWQLEHFGHGSNITPDVSVLTIIPFALMLLSIAVMPFIAKHFWEHNYPWISIALGVIVAGYYCFGVSAPELAAPRAMAKSFAEYICFICLLGSLYIVSGGIHIRVRRKATPLANTTLLLIGSILANLFGTTGASMLLIRPFLRMNKGHIRPYHIVFFIFSVSNLGGALTPIGDPPLFLGYLKGVPFWWVAEHCWPMWAVAVGAILAVFFVFDSISESKSPRPHHDENDPGLVVSIFGVSNLIFIAMIIGAVFLHPPYRELLMVLAAALSLWTTPQRVHAENAFNFAPIKEVAFLFVGIFATMVPALNFLATHAKDPAATRFFETPTQFYFSTGVLSGFLDNAPTYVTFLETELGKIDLPAGGESKIAILLADPKLNWNLVAISLGAVFFGALTYIGNGPNFMVKSIAENAGVKCPSFFEYIFRYSLPILLPILILIWAIFLMSRSGH